jgi:hypothetical protein
MWLIGGKAKGGVAARCFAAAIYRFATPQAHINADTSDTAAAAIDKADLTEPRHHWSPKDRLVVELRPHRRADIERYHGRGGGTLRVHWHGRRR